jgi:hypothetical protein
MAMYAAYYDTSGQQKDMSRPLVVAGLLSTESRWRRFEREWAAVLRRKEFNVPYLHMKEFSYSTGPYKDWKGDEPRRQGFLGALFTVIKRNVSKAYVTHLWPRDFVELNKSYVLKERLGGPYPLGASLAFAFVREWMGKKRPGQPTEHYFEAGDDGQRLFRALHEKNGRIPHIKQKVDPDTGEWFKPFQASDFVAYEVATEILRQEEGDKRTRYSRPGVLWILHHLPHEVRGHTVETLRSTFEDHPDRFPRRLRGTT